MKKRKIESGALIIILLIIFLISCSSPQPTDNENINNNDKPFGIGSSHEVLLKDSSIKIKLVYANNQTLVNFPSGIENEGTVGILYNNKFCIADTEFTNLQASTVLSWAYRNGKLSSNFEEHNGINNIAIKYGGQILIDFSIENCPLTYQGNGVFKIKDGYENKPLIYVTWYGAIMLCNWLTEMQDGNTENIVYTNITSTWTIDDMDTDISKRGYRLPRNMERLYAARYNGDNPKNTIPGYTNPYYLIGNSASGAEAIVSDETATKKVAVYNKQIPTPTEPANVKSLGSNSVNYLKLYDMSGNVSEWVEAYYYNYNGEYNVGYTGGSWNDGVDSLVIINFYWSSPNKSNNEMGFRICHTHE